MGRSLTSGFEPVDGCFDAHINIRGRNTPLTARRCIQSAELKFQRDVHKRLVQLLRRLRSDPKYGVIIGTASVGIFQSRLGLAYATNAMDDATYWSFSGRYAACRVLSTFLQNGRDCI